jgi:hypothetical protein
MFAVIRFRIFCLSVCYLKTGRLKYTELLEQTCLFFCMGVNLCLLHLRRKKTAGEQEQGFEEEICV